MKLMATKYLDTKDKMKLVNSFPPVVSMIHTFDEDLVSRRTFPHRDDDTNDHDNAEMFKKLRMVTKVILHSGFGNLKPLLLQAILDGNNTKIKLFKRKHGSLFGDSKNEWQKYLIRYIRNCCEKDPNYSGVQFKNIFGLHGIVLELIKKYPNLTLRIFSSTGLYLRNNTLIADEWVRGLITHLKIDYSLQVEEELPEEWIFISARCLEISLSWELTDGLIVDKLMKCLRRTPNVIKLTIEGKLHAVPNVHQIVDMLLTLPKLSTLSLKLTGNYQKDRIKPFVRLLMAPNDSNRLKELTVKVYGQASDFGRLSGILDTKIKDGFNYLNFETTFGNCRFYLNGSFMSIEDTGVRLVDLFNRFNHVRDINIYNNYRMDGREIEETKCDSVLITNNLPRNRCVNFKIDYEDYYYDSLIEALM